MFSDDIFLPEQGMGLFAGEPDLTHRRVDSEQEKIFANHVSDKETVSRIYIELLQLHSKVNPF